MYVNVIGFTNRYIPAYISQSNFSMTKAVIGRFKLPNFNVKWTSHRTGRLDLPAERAEWRADFISNVEDVAPVSITT